MNVNELIETALKEIVPGIWPLCCPEERSSEEYIVYNPELEESVLYADNKDREWALSMQIHLFTKKNYVNRRRRIRSALRDCGFTMTGIDTLYEKESGYYHLCFSCNIEEESEE